MIKYLYKRDNKSKIRVVSLILTRYNTLDGEFYTITGESGQNGGKQVKRPLVTIDKPKVNRTLEQQATLEYNSIINNYLDKGYVKASVLSKKEYADLTEQEIIDEFEAVKAMK